MTRLLPFLCSAACAGALSLAPALAQAPAVRVALCGAASTTNTACQWATVQTVLLATGQFAVVDIINATATGGGTPTLAQLQGYDALLVYTNSTPADNNAFGDVLADYVDAGGGVVVAVFANSTTSVGRNIGGRWQTGYEVILDQSGNASGAATLGTVVQPQHPVMQGVTAFVGGTTSSRPVGTALEVGATLIASWSDGKVLVAQGANPSRIDLGFYPPTAVCTQSGWSTGGDQLMTNALLYVAKGASFGTSGVGCAGTLGVPTMAAASGSRPVLGSTLTVDLGNVPLGLAIMAVGLSNTSLPPFTLPFDLAQFGMPGCLLRTDAQVTSVVAGVAPQAIWTLSIPNNPVLQGLIFYNQAFVVDPNANLAGLTITPGGRIRLGT